MKRALAGLALVAATLALSGCYYYPDYSYVRPVGGSTGGDAYYGSGVTYDNSYYYPGYYYPSYGYYGCCWGPAVNIGIGGVWYGGSRYYRGGRYYGHGWNGGRGGWGGGRGSWGGGHGGWGGHGH